jgi:hypothetical protein
MARHGMHGRTRNSTISAAVQSSTGECKRALLGYATSARATRAGNWRGKTGGMVQPIGHSSANALRGKLYGSRFCSSWMADLDRGRREVNRLYRQGDRKASQALTRRLKREYRTRERNRLAKLANQLPEERCPKRAAMLRRALCLACPRAGRALPYLHGRQKPLHPPSGYGIRSVVTERLEARQILTSKLVAGLASLKTPWFR